MISTTGGEGDFIRGFFQHLGSHGYHGVALHGWRNDFDDAASDVDLAVERRAFERLPWLMHEYCSARGWFLVQLFAHEDTALYGICVRKDAPERVVALDVCSDYQRDGVVFLTAEELIAARIALPWGGWKLPPALEFRYRFCKAAAKGKSPKSLEEDSAHCSAGDLEELAAWLGSSWKVQTSGQQLGSDLSEALKDFRNRAEGRKKLWRPRSWQRWAKRILQPGGLVIEWQETAGEAPPAGWMKALGASCFRRLRIGPWSSRMIPDLLRSGLCLCPKAPSWLRASRGLLLSRPTGPGEVVAYLAERIDHRLGIEPRRSASDSHPSIES